MSAAITVLYPNDEGSTFDMDYYLNTHIPLVRQRWEPMGMTSLKLVKGVATTDPNTPAPYQVIAILEFDSMDSFRQAGAAHGAEITGDIANFTSVRPVIQINDEIG